MAAITFRAATLDDLPAVCALGLEVNALHHARYPWIFAPAAAPDRDASYWRSHIEKADSDVVLACDGADVVAMAAVSIEQQEHSLLAPLRVCFVASVVVHEDRRSEGIGRRLMTQVEAWARERGARDLRLNVWHFSHAAQHLYRSLGFETRSSNMGKRLDGANAELTRCC